MMRYGLRDDPRLLRPHALLAGRDVLGALGDVLQHLPSLLFPMSRQIMQPSPFALDRLLVLLLQIVELVHAPENVAFQLLPFSRGLVGRLPELLGVLLFQVSSLRLGELEQPPPLELRFAVQRFPLLKGLFGLARRFPQGVLEGLLGLAPLRLGLG